MKTKLDSSTSEFFICFTSRTSSKSLTSPSHRSSLSSSLSSRLRTSGSIKGGQSPGMFAGKKKGSAFEAAEPSSPKVTCIGQVRVKSKKKKKSNGNGGGKNLNLASSRSRSGRYGDVSFRRDGGGRRDVLNCFVPCGWSGCSGGEKREKRGRSSKTTASCGAVFVRWLMHESAAAAAEEEEEKRRELVGLVVDERGGNEMGMFGRGEEMVDEVFARREIVGEVFKRSEEEVEEDVVVDREGEVEEEEEGGVSLCIPPRNALLLMRCRSDPVRMAALANRSWDMPVVKVECRDEEEEDDDDEDKEEEKKKVDEVKKREEVVVNEEEEEEVEEKEMSKDLVERVCFDVEEIEKEVVVDEGELEGEGLGVDEEKSMVEEAKEEVVVMVKRVEEEEEMLGEMLQEVEKVDEPMVVDELGENGMREKTAVNMKRAEELEIKLRRSISCSATKSSEFSKTKEGGRRRSFSYKERKDRRNNFSIEREGRRHSFCSEKEARRSSFSVDKDGKRRWNFSIEKENLGPKEKEKPVVQKKEKIPATEVVKEAVKLVEPKIVEKPQVKAIDEAIQKPIVSKGGEAQVVEREKKGRELPDCLLLMMYEPKLSMEVSKETWVCSTDFLQWRPNHNHQPNPPPETKAKTNAGDNSEKKKCTESNNVVTVPTANSTTIQQPPSKPPPTLSPFEQKLLKSVAVGPLLQPPYGHFVLTRCKSEPGKSSARLAPESCFWKARHQPIGAAGLGF